ncbi:MAG: PEP-CTERM sorting domain-containing protein [Anaerohalosphaeraceae bacterium]|nr:PEP-CTERM sorting domain-containing protein [Anaerohalosphaeraceae bacterium]
MRKIIFLAVLLSVAVSSYAVVITTSVADLWQLFPKDTQGENGIQLQYRTGSIYTDLTYFDDYSWKTPSTMWNLPYVIKDAAVTGKISAVPSAVTQVGCDRDPLMRVRLDGTLNQVRVTGTAAMENSGSVTFYIYKGSASYGSPLWSAILSGVSSTVFDFVVDFTPTEELFFAVDAGSTDYCDHNSWYDIQLTGIPEPATLALFVLGGLLLGRKRSA